MLKLMVKNCGMVLNPQKFMVISDHSYIDDRAQGLLPLVIQLMIYSISSGRQKSSSLNADNATPPVGLLSFIIQIYELAKI